MLWRIPSPNESEWSSLIIITSLCHPCSVVLHGLLSVKDFGLTLCFKPRMNHSRTIRTASRCIDDCCGKQTSEGKEKSHFYTITRICLSVGDVQRPMVWANGCKPNAACVRLRNTWTPEQKWQKWMQENGFFKNMNLPVQEKNDQLWGKFCFYNWY